MVGAGRAAAAAALAGAMLLASVVAPASADIICSEGRFQVADSDECSETAVALSKKISAASALTCHAKRFVYFDSDACKTAVNELEAAITDVTVGGLSCDSFADGKFAIASKTLDKCDVAATAYTCFAQVGSTGSAFEADPKLGDAGNLASTRVAVAFTAVKCERVRCALAEAAGSIDSVAGIWALADVDVAGLIDVTATGAEQTVTFKGLSANTGYVLNCVSSAGSPVASGGADNSLSFQTLPTVIETQTSALECADGTISEDRSKCACGVGFKGGGAFIQEDGQWAETLAGSDGELRDGCVAVSCSNGVVSADRATCACDIGYAGGGAFNDNADTYPTCSEAACENGDVRNDKGACDCGVGYDGGGDWLEREAAYPACEEVACPNGKLTADREVCTCTTGFEGGGAWSDNTNEYAACEDINGCKETNCNAKGTCSDVEAPGIGFKCECFSGYSGDECEEEPEATCGLGAFITADSKTAEHECKPCDFPLTYQDLGSHRSTTCLTQTVCAIGQQISADSIVTVAGEDTSTVKRSCSACPEDTYMLEVNHQNLACWATEHRYPFKRLDYNTYNRVQFSQAVRVAMVSLGFEGVGLDDCSGFCQGTSSHMKIDFEETQRSRARREASASYVSVVMYLRSGEEARKFDTKYGMGSGSDILPNLVYASLGIDVGSPPPSDLPRASPYNFQFPGVDYEVARPDFQSFMTIFRGLLEIVAGIKSASDDDLSILISQGDQGHLVLQISVRTLEESALINDHEAQIRSTMIQTWVPPTTKPNPTEVATLPPAESVDELSGGTIAALIVCVVVVLIALIIVMVALLRPRNSTQVMEMAPRYPRVPKQAMPVGQGRNARMALGDGNHDTRLRAEPYNTAPYTHQEARGAPAEAEFTDVAVALEQDGQSEFVGLNTM